MLDWPTGNVTFLFTDIQDSTRLWEEHPDAMRAATARHDAVLRTAIEEHTGYIFRTLGDAFYAAFASPAAALAAALAAQRALVALPPRAAELQPVWPLRVRMGLHTGPAEPRDGDYSGYLTLSRVQRVMTAGHGGQMLLSEATAEALRDDLPAGVSVRDLGAYRLRGLARPERIFQVVAPDLPAGFPPLRAWADAGDLATSSLRYLAGGVLVGRGRELDQLREQWHTAQAGQGHLLLLSGEPGVGKTRLARELIADVEAQGATVLRGGCYEFEATLPYLPFVEALRAYVRDRPADLLRAEIGSNAAELAKLAPELEARLGPLTPNPPLPPNEERLRLFDHVARTLHTLAAPRGLLFFVDDLHWADRGTLALLQYISRQLRDERLLFLAAYREAELDRTHPLAAALVDWNRARLAVRLPLGRLSATDTQAMLAGLFGRESVSREFGEAIYRETEGNPFFIEEVVKALVEAGEIYREDSEWQRKEISQLAIPQSIKEAVGRRLSRLSAPATDVLHTAAALGRIFLFAELAAATPADEDAVLDALDEAGEAQLIRPEQGDAFSFTHDKIRETLYLELNPVRRRRLHGRIGEVLERLYAGNDAGEQLTMHAADLARHFVEASNWQKGLTYSVRAAENAVRVFAHDEALTYYESARECAEALNRPDQVAAIIDATAGVYEARGQFQLAAEWSTRALNLATDPKERAALKARIGTYYAQIGDQRGLELLQAAQHELDPTTQPAELAWTTAALGRYHHYRTEHAQAIVVLERARELAEPLDDPALLANIYGFLAGAYQHLARFDLSMDWARRTLALGERLNDLSAVASGYEFLAEDSFLIGEWGDAIEFARLDRETGEKIGSQARAAWAGFPMAGALYGRGDLAAARAAAQKALEVAQAIGELRLTVWLGAFVQFVEADLGAEALAPPDIAWVQRADELGQLVLQSWTRHAVAHAHAQREEWAHAVDVYAERARLLAGSESRIALLATAPYHAEACCACGRLEEAAEIAGTHLALARDSRSRHYEGIALRVRGQVLTAQGAHEAAGQDFDAAVAILDGLGSGLELARALYHRGLLSRKRSQLDAARADLTRARNIFAACGAAPDLARTEASLQSTPW